MWKRMTGYFATVLLVIYLFFMYDETVLSGILVLVILYPVCACIFLLLCRKKITAALDRVPPMGEKDKRIRAGVSVKNASRRFPLRCEAQLSVGNRTSGKKIRRRFGGLILPGQEETFWCEFETAFCGNVEVILESVRLYDLFGIFYIKQKVQRKASVKVMPEFELMPVEITRATREFQADAEEYSGEKKGDDPSELYQVREYRIQDSVRDIHWKLSAKEETFMVKERGFPLGCVVLVWIDFAEKERSAAGFSRLLETAASLSITLAEQKCIHLAAWYEEKNERIGMKRVKDEESACELIWQLMEIEPYRDPVRKQACFDDTFRGHEFSSTVTIDGQGVLRKDGEVPELLRL